MLQRMLNFLRWSPPPQRCPACDEVIQAEKIRASDGTVLCPQCGERWPIEELTFSEQSVAELLERPPSACWIENLGPGLVVITSYRTPGNCLGATLLALFWNGLTLAPVMVALAGLYSNVVGPLPKWLPGHFIKDGQPADRMEWSIVFFLFAFLTPFVIIGLVMIWCALLYTVGKLKVVIDPSDSVIIEGVGFLSFRRRFDPRLVRSVWLTKKGDDNSPKLIMSLADHPTIEFGDSLPPERMQWLRAVLKELLLRSADDQHVSKLPPLAWLSRHRSSPP
jgi:hypothetical protein